MSGYGRASGRRRPGPGCAVVGMALRVPAFAAVSIALGAVAHSAADGWGLPPWRLLAVAEVGVVVCTLPARRRELTFGALAGLLVLTQAVVHVVLCLCHCLPTSSVGTVVHRVLCPEVLAAQQARWAADPWLVATAQATPAAHGTGYLDHLVPGGGMLAAHVLAALVTAWWLRRGEAAVWRAARAVWPRLVAFVLPPVVVRPLPRVRPQAVPAPLRSLVEATAVHRHRGPPVLV